MGTNFPDAPTEGQLARSTNFNQSSFIYQSGKWRRREGWNLITRSGPLHGTTVYGWDLPAQYLEFKLVVKGFTPGDGVNAVTPFLGLSADNGATWLASGTWAGFYTYTSGTANYCVAGGTGAFQIGGSQNGDAFYYAPSLLEVDIHPGSTGVMPIISWTNLIQQSGAGPIWLTGHGYYGAAVRLTQIYIHYNGQVGRLAQATLMGLMP